MPNRWTIKGSITTLSPLHIGCGDTVQREGFTNPKTDDPVEVSAVTTDHTRRPYIPGSALKGVLRSAIVRVARVGDMIDAIFGSGAEDKHIGGKAEFHDALLRVGPPNGTGGGRSELVGWDSSRHAAVRTGVAIDRDYRTAAEHKLFHFEYVPPNASFSVTISARNATDQEIALILASLNRFSDMDCRLGAFTSNGYGAVKWQLESIEHLGSDGLWEWLNSGGSGYQGLQAVDEDRRRKLVELSEEMVKDFQDGLLRIPIKVRFSGPFLSMSPQNLVPGIKGQKGSETAAGELHAWPIRDYLGRVYLPSSSFRGSLRFQAERILRTLGLRACHEGDPEGECSPLNRMDKVGNLCDACRVFGGPGWKSPTRFSDLLLVGEEVIYNQEFVAIDRFTGGGAPGFKFNCETVFAPQLEGEIVIDAARLDAQLRGLLWLTLRDLQEGDIVFGHGGGKGYGSCSEVAIEMSSSQDCSTDISMFQKYAEKVDESAKVKG